MDALESVVDADALESVEEALESVVDALESVVDALESVVDPLESVVDALEREFGSTEFLNFSAILGPLLGLKKFEILGQYFLYGHFLYKFLPVHTSLPKSRPYGLAWCTEESSARKTSRDDPIL